MLFRLTPTNRKRNPPLSALISILESLHRLSRNSFGIVVFSARQSEPELRLNHPDSPVIGTRQEMVFGKMGGLSDRPSRRMRGRYGETEYPESIPRLPMPKIVRESLVYWTTTWSMSKYLFTSKRVLSIVRPFFPIAIALS